MYQNKEKIFRKDARRSIVAISVGVGIIVAAGSAAWALNSTTLDPNGSTIIQSLYDDSCRTQIQSSDITQKASTVNVALPNGTGINCNWVGLKLNYTRYGVAYTTSVFKDYSSPWGIYYTLPTSGVLNWSIHYVDGY